jgi:hypothetical protein
MRHPSAFPELTPPAGGLVALRQRLAPRRSLALRVAALNALVATTAAVLFVVARPDPSTSDLLRAKDHPAFATLSGVVVVDTGVVALKVHLDSGAALYWVSSE